MAPSPSTLKWRVLAGYFLSYMFDAVDILILAIAMPAISASLQIGPMQAGLLATATLLGIGMSGLVMGPLADRWGRRKVLLLSLGSFGALTMAVAGATDWREVLALRFLSGLGLGSVWGIAAAHVNETWPAHQRARATSFVLSSFSIGAAIAAAAASYLLPAHGWRALFFVCGAAVVIAMVYVWRYVPESETWLADRQRKRAGAPQGGRARRRPVRAGPAARDAAGHDGLGADAGRVLGRQHLAADLPAKGTRAGDGHHGALPGPAQHRHVRRLQRLRLYRRPRRQEKALILSLVCSGLLLPFYVQATDHLLLLWLGPVFAFFMAFAGLMGSYFAELFPTQLRATGAGFCFNVGRGISAFAPLLLGSMSATFGFGPSIAACGGVFVIAAAVVLLLPAGKTAAAEEPVAAH